VVELAFDLVIDVGPAVRAEVEGGPVATVGNLDEGLRPALDRRLRFRPARLHREGAPRALLAIEAVADGNAHRLAGDGGAKLPAAAGSGADCHPPTKPSSS